MANNDKILCTKKTITAEKTGWKATTKNENTKRKIEDPSGKKYEYKVIDCKTAGKKYFYKDKKKVLTDEEKQKKAEDCGHANWEDYKNSGWKCDGKVNVTPGPENIRYQDCTGKKTRFNGCRDTDGIISKVQGCIGVKQDGYFGPKTESALVSKTGKEVFTTDEVDTICKGSESPEIFMPTTTEDKVEYFKDLVKKNRIYPKGIIHKRPNGDVAYVIKYVNQEPSPLDSSSSLGQQVNIDDIEKGSYDIVYHFAPKTKKDQGIWTRLIVDTRYGEKKLKLQTPDEDMTWEPDPEMDTDIFMESKLKSILKNVLLEQQYEGLNVKIPNRKSNVSGNQGQPGSQTTTGGSTPQTQQGGQTSMNTKPDPVKVKEIIEPIKGKTLQLLADIQNDPKFKIGAKEEDKKQLNVAIETLKDFDTTKACEESSIKMIDDNIKFIDETIKKNESTFGAASLIAKMKEIKVNLQKVKSECQKLQSEAQSQSSQVNQTQQGSSNTTSQTQQGSSNTSTTTQTNKPEELTQNEPTELSEEQCRNLVVQYLYGAISTSQYGDVGSEMASGKILEPNVIKNRMCGCRIKYGFDNIKIKKDDFTGKYQLDPKLLKFGSNDVLNWKEIKELIQTGVDKKFFRRDKGELTIGRKYRDSSFGEVGMCKGQINESISKTVKSHIFEAINKKEKIN